MRIIDWFNSVLDMGIRRKLLTNIETTHKLKSEVNSLHEAIDIAFDWFKSPEREGYWMQIYNMAKNGELQTIENTHGAGVSPLSRAQAMEYQMFEQYMGRAQRVKMPEVKADDYKWLVPLNIMIDVQAHIKKELTVQQWLETIEDEGLSKRFISFIKKDKASCITPSLDVAIYNTNWVLFGHYEGYCAQYYYELATKGQLKTKSIFSQTKTNENGNKENVIVSRVTAKIRLGEKIRGRVIHGGIKEAAIDGGCIDHKTISSR